MDAQESIVGGVAIRITKPSAERLDLLGAWFEAEYAGLLRFAYFVTGDRSTAEDLVQETFVRLWRAGARTDHEGIAAYARTAIVNLARSGHRRRARELARVSGGRGRSSDRQDAHDPGARDEMWRAILTLSPRQRAVVALRFYEDLSEREIAQTLGMSPGAVKKHADRAMKKLRELLGRQP